ncbi:MAG TPA: O-antigen ligase family protein [Opitutaceae bacterium]|jgi:hypothetical protein
MTAWSQIVSLVLAAAAFVTSVLPRDRGVRDEAGRVPGRFSMASKLARFPIFWIGLALLGYVAVQASNPAWAYARSATRWWLVRQRDVPWLPAGIAAPFSVFNAWRQLIIYGATWLTVCAVWTGLRRRRSLSILLGIITANGLALVAVLALQRVTNDHRTPWPLVLWTRNDITASFVYENHAGAYLGLASICAIAMAICFFDRGRRSFAKSTPAGVFALCALFLAGSVIFSLSRGALIALAVSLFVLACWFLIRNRVLPDVPGGNKALRRGVIGLLAVFVALSASFLDFKEMSKRLDLFATEGSKELSVHSRVLARHADTDMLGVYWERGVGAGGFRYLFPEYVKNYPEIYDGGNLFWEHGHCDWLELPIELGLAGDLMIVTGAVWWMAWFVRRRAFWSALAVPLLIGCSQTLIQAGFDFPFQCPAILTTWCVLIAVAGRWVELEPPRAERAGDPASA